MNTLYLKNLAGDLIQVCHNPVEETLFHLRQKLGKILNVEDIWRIQFLDYEENKEIVNYFVIDQVDVDIKIKYKNRLIDIVENSYYDQYLINVSILENNYDYYVYYDNYDNRFVSQDDVKFYSFNSSYSIIVDDTTTYPDLKTLLLETKFFPIMYREKIANIANDKWFMLYYS